jgi:hypothetical protein
MYDMRDNLFNNNSAETRGGAIYYDMYSPINISSNNFHGNYAPYGQNYGSYAFKIKEANYDKIS